MTATLVQKTQRIEKYPLLGTRIVLDEKKILKDGKYDLEKMYKLIDEVALESGLIKIDKYTYHCKGNEKDPACLGILLYKNLIHCDWFTLNVKEWDWISEKEGNKDLITANKARNMGVRVKTALNNL